MPENPTITNILSIDVEDWYQLTGEQLSGHGTPQPEKLAKQMDRLLALLAKHDTRATFFCLGKSLEASPHIVHQIANAGHEIASHGWGHELIFKIGLDRFRDDLRRSLDWLGELVGRPILGYRAPAFSVSRSQLDGFHDICLDAKLAYDSSVFPIRGRRYGIEEFPLEPTVVRERNGRRLVELPLATVCYAGKRRAIAGGGHWRLWPGALIDAAIKRINAEKRPVVTYFHPYEFDANRLDAVVAAGPSMRARRRGLMNNLRRKSIYGKLDTMLARHRFGAAEDYLRHAELI